jgi:PAS domain S-box-containing protein
MELLFGRIKNWFGSNYLENIDDFYEKAKIRLLFRVAFMAFFTLLFSLPATYLINPLAALISGFALILIALIPYLLQRTDSVSLTGKFTLIISFLIVLNVHLVYNQPAALGVGAWYIVIILCSSFILGRDWGFGFTVATAVAICLLVGLRYFDITLYDSEFEFRIDQSPAVLLSTPFHTILPIFLIYLVVLEFLKSKSSSDNYMTAMVTKEKLLNQKLEQSELKYRKFIEEADDLIYVIEKSGKFSYINPTFERVTGYSLKELKKMDFNFLIHEDYRTAHLKFYSDQIEKQAPVTYYEFPIYTNKMELVWIGQKVQMNYKKGKMFNAICIARDVTQRKATEKELIAAKEEAIKASRTKAQFLSSMSHEIRTPMNAVIGMTHLLLDDNPRPDQLENLNTLRFSSENLVTIINDILDFSKIESGKMDFEEVDFNLKYIISSIHHALSGSAIDKGLKFQMKYESDLPDFVKGDPVRLSQVLNNLIGNAIKFTNKGHVVIQVGYKSSNEKEIEIEFSVLDTGIGIPESKLTAIFDNFTQASSDTTRNYGGTGLGLAISKQLVELQGGKIKVESIEGKGSQFYFSLTFKKSNQSNWHSVTGRSENNNIVVHSLKGLKVLLAEDNKINQVVAGKFLSKWEVEMDIAENGAEALEMVQNKNYNLVLMDLQMPVLDGFEATKKIRKLGGKYSKIPIIALTASAVLEIHEEAISAGMDDFVTKPFDPKLLNSKLHTYAQVNDSATV